MTDNDIRFPRASWQLYLDSGSRIEMEFDANTQLWIAVGQGIAAVNAWFKEVAGFDIRVAIERQPNGLAIRLDQGDDEPGSSPEGAPELILRVQTPGTVQVIARGPLAGEEVVLAEIAG